MPFILDDPWWFIISQKVEKFFDLWVQFKFNLLVILFLVAKSKQKICEIYVKVEEHQAFQNICRSQLRSERCVHRLAWFMTIICVWKINLKVDKLSVIGLWLNHGSVSLALQWRLTLTARSPGAQETSDSFSLKRRCSQGLEICCMTFNQAAPVNATLHGMAQLCLKTLRDRNRMPWMRTKPLVALLLTLRHDLWYTTQKNIFR